MTVAEGAGNGDSAGRAMADRALEAAIEQKDIPGVVAMAVNRQGVIYQGAFGTADVTGRALAVDAIFNKYAKANGLEVVKAVVDGVGRLIDFNYEYYSGFTSEAKLIPIQAQVKESISGWLGIGDRGGIVKNGYLDTLLKDVTIRQQVKNGRSYSAR